MSSEYNFDDIEEDIVTKLMANTFRGTLQFYAKSTIQ